MTEEAKPAEIPEGFVPLAGVDTPFYLLKKAGATVIGEYQGRYFRNTKGINGESHIHQIKLTHSCMAAYRMGEGDGEVLELDELEPGMFINVWESHQLEKELTPVPRGTEVFIRVEGKKKSAAGRTFWNYVVAAKR